MHVIDRGVIMWLGFWLVNKSLIFCIYSQSDIYSEPIKPQFNPKILNFELFCDNGKLHVLKAEIYNW